MTFTLLTFAVALFFAAIHIASPHLTLLARLPHSVWLSFAGGVSVGYVFVHVLPELAAWQAEMAEVGRLVEAEIELFLVALAGLSVFYGVESYVRKRAGPGASAPEPTRLRAFRLHVVSFALYNGLIGYLVVHREETGALALILFAFALGLHFMVNDRSLWREHGERYMGFGRWLLAAAVLLGWGLGVTTGYHQAIAGPLFAFLAGGIVLNVLKEELPAEAESSFPSFAAGVLLYAGLGLLA